MRRGLMRSSPDAPPVARSPPTGHPDEQLRRVHGVILALEKAVELGAREVDLVLDSMLIVEQLSGRWKVKHPADPATRRARPELLRGFDRWSIRHERREFNRQADAMANLALDDPRAAAAAEREGFF